MTDNVFKRAAAILASADERGKGWRRWRLPGEFNLWYWSRSGWVFAGMCRQRDLARLILTGLLMPRAVAGLREWAKSEAHDALISTEPTDYRRAWSNGIAAVLDKMTALGLGPPR